MKILFVDLKYDYGVKSRGVNLIGQDGFKKSMEQLGHDVVPFYYDHYLRGGSALQKALLDTASSTQPDLVFFSLFRNQFEHETLIKLKEKYCTINWFGDDQWRFDSFTKYYANDFTWCVTTDVFSIEKYQRLGQSNVILSQWAAIDSHIDYISDCSYRYDVSFVGGYHPYRDWFIKTFESISGLSVAKFGHGWPAGSISAEDMVQLFQQTKVNLNISNSNSLDIRYLFSSPKALLNSIRSRKVQSQVKARNFEIPFFGGFELTDFVPSIDRYFDIGKEIVCYSNVEEAALQALFYLENQQEREVVKNAGHHKAYANHGYIHRIKEVLEAIG